MNTEVQQSETAIDLFISQELERFDKEVISEKDLQKLVKQYSGLKVNGIDDREGLNAVRKARIDLKNKVVEIKKKGKATRDSAVKFQKAVIERENSLVDIIEPTKKELEAEEDRIAELKEQQRLEEERKESERIQNRLDRLNAVEAAIDFHTLSQLSDEEFEYKLHEATIAFREIERQREEQRIAEENEAKVRAQAQKDEEERQTKLKAEQEAKEKAFAEEQRKFREEQERIAEENRRKDTEFEAERSRIAAEKKAIEDAKAKEEAEKKRLQDIEEAKKAAAEQALKDKAEADRKAKEEEEERINSASDKEKFQMITDLLGKHFDTNTAIWQVKSKSGKEACNKIQAHLLEAYNIARTKAGKAPK